MSKSLEGKLVSQGFSIVELVVVIIVIGILATIVGVNYGNWQDTATIAQLKSDLTNIASAAESYRNFNNAYPSSIPSSIKINSGTTVNGGSSDGKTFCYDATSSRATDITYYIDNVTAKSGAKSGNCASRPGAPAAPTGPDVYVTLIGSNVQAAVDAITCASGTTAQYAIRSMINNEDYTNYSAFSTIQTYTQSANDGVKYTYQAKARCVDSTGQAGAEAEGATSSYTDPILAPTIAPTVALDYSASTSSSTIWNITGIAVPSGLSVRYQYVYSVAPSGYNSGSIIATTNQLSFSTNAAGQTYTVTVQAQYYNTNISSTWGPTSAASSFYRPIWTKLFSGDSHMCGISQNNSVYCWARNDQGQLGNNTYADSLLPVPVYTGGVLAGKTIKTMTVGYRHTCVIASDDQVYCWGRGTEGQLGNGIYANSPIPVAVTTSGLLSGKTVKAITAGIYHTCVVASDNKAYCWGYNYYGQLGNTSTSSSSTAVAVTTTGALSGKTLNNFTGAIGAGDYHTCVTATDGLGYCWGRNDYGQLGNNSTTQSTFPVAVVNTGVLSGKNLTTIYGGYSSICALANDNQAYCWGRGTSGQLGNSAASSSSVPVAVYTSGVLSGKTLKSLSVGTYHACAIANNDQTYCWGYNFYGQLGINSQSSSTVPAAVNTSGVLSGKTIKQLSAGYMYSCVVASDNLGYCWGYNLYGVMSTYNNPFAILPVVNTGVLAGKTIKSASIGFYHMCVVASDNLPYCWGYGGYGGIGNNSTSSQFAPAAVSTTGVLSGKTVSAITVGTNGNYTCTIASDNLAYCWGDNAYGQLGNSSTAQSNIPVQVNISGVLSGKTIKQISAGANHACAIASDSLAYCWGSDTYGRLGDNTTTQTSVPVAVYASGVLSSKTILAISAGTYHTCAIASDNLAYCWGYNASGQLGNNSTTQSQVPVAVDTSGVLSGKTIKSISVGNGHSCVVASDNKAYCWGSNSNGQLGNNSYSNSLVPVAVDTSGVLAGKTVTSIAASTQLHTCVTTSEYRAYCWGHDNDGRLGDLTTIQSPVPVAVSTSGIMSGKSIKTISDGYWHSCSITTDDQLYCWGNNLYGELGNKANSVFTVPILMY